MTFDTKTDFSNDAENESRTMSGRRQGEAMPEPQVPGAAGDSDAELIFPAISAPPVWPRVFPGL